MSIRSFWRQLRKFRFSKAIEDEPIPGAVYYFALDHRPIGDEITKLVEELSKLEHTEFVAKIDGVKRKIYFIGDDFYCPYYTPTSSYLAVSQGKFYRCKKDLELNLEFDMISYEFLVQLKSALIRLL